MIVRTRKPARRGFTLIEILLVVAILAMLAAFAIPMMFGTQEQASVDICKSSIKNVEQQLNVYRTQNGQFPTTDQGLKALVEKPEEEPIPKKWSQLFEEVPQDPWKHELKYAFPGEHNKEKKPDVWSVGADGQDGTADDIGNWTDESKEDESSGSEKK